MRSLAMGGGGGGERPRPPHRSGGSGSGGSELFICFTARPSTSMRARSARSLHSPGRNHRDPAVPPLSASMSRRLRSSGSLKGGQSPVFPPRKGCAFRPAEPSSPKVTCIGQVRVKSKAKNKGERAALRSRSDSLRKREEGKGGIGEEGRECLRNRNHSWVYQLPTSICEGLRTIGSEFNCFLPCGGGRSPCFSSSNARDEKQGGGGGGGREEKRPATSCGAVFVRWLMAIEETDNGEGGEMVGLVVGEREKGELDLVLREMEKREMEVQKGGGVEKQEEEVVVVKEEVVCVPPKNALLLMRCRSDPVKVAALASRLFGSPATKFQEEEEEEEEEGNGNEERKDDGKHLVAEEMRTEDGIESNEEVEVDAEDFSRETGEERRESETQRSLDGVILSVRVEEKGAWEDRESEEKEKEIVKEGFLVESHGLLSDPAEIDDTAQTKLQEKQQERDLKDETFSLKRGEEKEEEDMKGKESGSCSLERNEEKEENVVEKEVEEIRSGRCSSECSKEAIRHSSPWKKERRRHSFSTEREARRHSFSTEREATTASISVDKEGRMSWSFFIEKKEIKVESEELPAEAEGENKKEPLTEEEDIREAVEVETLKPTGEAQVVTEERREEEENGEEEEEENREELPDCLLLMMYEPKLSMEVSRETWVCSNDFLHGHRHHHGHSSKQGGNSTSKQKAEVDRAGDGTRVKVAKAGDGRCVGGQGVTQSIESRTQHPPHLAPVPALPSAVERKLLSGVAASLVPEYEGFVLTRCKSEPMRSSARLAADAGFWKNRHRPIGTIGF